MIELDVEQMELLAAVQAGRVHNDPRFVRPDFEADPDIPGRHRRANLRLRPLKRAELVELADTADDHGVRLYRLTEHGAQVLARWREITPDPDNPATTAAASKGAPGGA